MKKELTREQSAHLIELGVSADKASDLALDYKDINNTKLPLERRPVLPIFTLADVMELLPKEIKEGVTTFHLNIDFPFSDEVAARYIDPDDIDNDILGVMCVELIDAIYELLCKTIKAKHYQQ